MVVSPSFQDKYVDYLIKELKLKVDEFKDLETIYIGGGTPSVLKLSILEKLFVELHNKINFSKIKEFTIEANPADVTIDFINLIKKYKVNRISLGVESLDKKKLLLLNRKHNKKQVINALKLLKENNINNINVDLIYGLNNESFNVIKKDIKTLKKYVTHFSCYNLILEEKTILYKLKEKGLFKELSEGKEKKIYYKIIKLLERNGFRQYEVSNFALDSFASLHNLIYWDFNYYSAIGASASSFISKSRKTNINNINLYYEGIDNNKLIYSLVEELKEEDEIKEFIMMGLRKIDGIDLDEFKERFNIDFMEKYPFTRNLIDKGVLNINKSSLKVARSALFVMNEILVYYM